EHQRRGTVHPQGKNIELFQRGRKAVNVGTINARNELQYLLAVQTLEDMARDGLLEPKELETAKRLAREKYRPFYVWE
ncbi:MAG: hypothetical protein IJT94_00005, partial [Oscillibacter sp.]|nr:hypothetical protein [Oscillibacter sp.]